MTSFILLTDRKAFSISWMDSCAKPAGNTPALPFSLILVTSKCVHTRGSMSLGWNGREPAAWSCTKQKMLRQFSFGKGGPQKRPVSCFSGASAPK